jgi:hypothetical protein
LLTEIEPTERSLAKLQTATTEQHLVVVLSLLDIQASFNDKWSEHRSRAIRYHGLIFKRALSWDTREPKMLESLLDTPLNTNSSQTYSMIPTWGSDTDWSVPPHVEGLVATGKDRDSSLNDVLLTHRQAMCTDPLMKTTPHRTCLHMRWRWKAFLLLCQHLPADSLVACIALCRWMVQ